MVETAAWLPVVSALVSRVLTYRGTWALEWRREQREDARRTAMRHEDFGRGG